MFREEVTEALIGAPRVIKKGKYIDQPNLKTSPPLVGLKFGTSQFFEPSGEPLAGKLKNLEENFVHVQKCIEYPFYNWIIRFPITAQAALYYLVQLEYE